MFAIAGSTGARRRGTALIVVMTMLMVVSGLLAAMMTLHIARDQSESASEARLARMVAAEAGLERVRLEVLADGGWLPLNAGLARAQFLDGASSTVDSFMVGTFQITVEVTQADAHWYLVRSTATETRGGRQIRTTLGMTTRGGTLFSDYARFVSKGVLDIGDYASYGGKVHCNSNINVNGTNVTFWDDVTAAGRINYSDRKNTVFHKRATPGVPYIALPEADEIEAMAKAAPAGAVVYDYQNPAFRAKFRAETGVYPTSGTNVTIVFKQDKMDVVTTSNGKTMTETNVLVPHDGTVYCRENVGVSGNISRRLSVATRGDVHVNNAIRYTDDSGAGQWQLQDKYGNPMLFDTGKNSWSTTGQWDGPDYNYVQAADWEGRKPVVGGEKIQPALGLVAADTIYISGTNDNREVHAALFTSGDVIRPNVGGGTKKNLYILGAIITTGTNPVSSYFSYRCYAYDPCLRGHPPPGFPGGDVPAFHNWHVVGTDLQ